MVLVTEARLENTFAVSLLKHVHFLNDTKGRGLALRYLRTKDGREVDFVLADDQGMRELIEVKSTDARPSHTLTYFKDRFFHDARCVQAVMHLKREQHASGVDIRDAGAFLAELSA